MDHYQRLHISAKRTQKVGMLVLLQYHSTMFDQRQERVQRDATTYNCNVAVIVRFEDKLDTFAC